MTVYKDESGRRWVQVEVEVPGTLEEVWQAIATGPGRVTARRSTPVIRATAAIASSVVTHAPASR